MSASDSTNGENWFWNRLIMETVTETLTEIIWEVFFCSSTVLSTGCLLLICLFMYVNLKTLILIFTHKNVKLQLGFINTVDINAATPQDKKLKTSDIESIYRPDSSCSRVKPGVDPLDSLTLTESSTGLMWPSESPDFRPDCCLLTAFGFYTSISTRVCVPMARGKWILRKEKSLLKKTFVKQ